MSTHPPEKESAHGCETGARETIKQICAELRPVLRGRQVRIVSDDRTARHIAHKAGVALLLASVPPQDDGITIAVGRIGGASVLVMRFFGWQRPIDNGWACMIGPPAVIEGTVHILTRWFVVPGTARTFTGGLN